MSESGTSSLLTALLQRDTVRPLTMTDPCFQSPQAGGERTSLLPPPEGKYTYQTRKGQVQLKGEAR